MNVTSLKWMVIKYRSNVIDIQYTLNLNGQDQNQNAKYKYNTPVSIS